MIRQYLYQLIVCVSCLQSVLCPATADDWPQWLGPRRDGIWRETGILEQFPTEGPKLLWRAAIGGGYSGPAVCDGRVFVLDWKNTAKDKSNAKLLHEGEPPQNSNFVRKLLPGNERVHCLNEATGEVLWTHEYECP
jgi:outer membrane protein assembly factor BamB